MTVAGLVLAGGRSSRFGSDKALAELGGVRLLDRAVTALQSRADTVAVNAPYSGPVAALAQAAGIAVIVDQPGLATGPLAGILSGLRWAKALGASCMLSLPCDVVAIPLDAYARMLEASADGAYAVTGDGPQSLCAAWSVNGIAMLEAALVDGSHPPVRQVLDELGAMPVFFDSGFRNINTQEDLAAAIRAL